MNTPTPAFQPAPSNATTSDSKNTTQQNSINPDNASLSEPDRKRRAYMARLGIGQYPSFPGAPVKRPDSQPREDKTSSSGGGNNGSGYAGSSDRGVAQPDTKMEESGEHKTVAEAVAEEMEAVENKRSFDFQFNDGTEGGPPAAHQIMHRQGGDRFRNNFLAKLSYENIWQQPDKRPPTHQCVIIFDWDDTILCTSFLNHKAIHTVQAGNLVEKQLRHIEKVASQLFDSAKKLTQLKDGTQVNTFIITNAMEGWVEYSCNKYVPGLYKYLDPKSSDDPAFQNEHPIRVISARTENEQQFPNNYHEWKIQAFQKVAQAMDSEIITNLISLGDSNFEMDAVHHMCTNFNSALTKTIKFRENPTPEELVKQLELVNSKFEKIVLNARNLKIGLERKWVASPRPKDGSSGSGAPANGPAPGQPTGGNASAKGDLSVVPEGAKRQ